MTYEEFRIGTLKANQKKHHFKINNSYGIKDAYRWARKNKFIRKEISEKDFRLIINAINQSLQDHLLNGGDIKFPELLGRVEVRKYKTYVGLEGDKIRTNMAIDWDKTLKLWYEDEEAFNNRTLIRCESNERFKIIYNKSKAKYNNKTFYEFAPTRQLRIKLKELINNQGFDALLLSKENGLC